MGSNMIVYLGLMILGQLLFGLNFLMGFQAVNIYAALFIIIYIFYRSEYLISPQNILHAYYLLFFIIPPYYAELHKEDDFSTIEFYLIYTMVYATHLTAAFGSKMGIASTISDNTAIRSSSQGLVSLKNIKLIIVASFVLSSFCVVAIIQLSGGLLLWMSNPGEAFLNRGGTGIYVIISHFSTFILAAFTGYYAYLKKSKFILFFFVCWLAVTSPVHGSKMIIIIFLCLAFLPWLRNVKIMTLKSFAIGILFSGIFIYGLYLRNISWITLDAALPYALNYFTALSNFRTVIDDFLPNFFQTFFLPFNKFLTPFGLSDLNIYYDMNHMLTDIYFPESWAIRATEQWPVEVDLYLNFYFLFGLFLPFIYMYIVSKIYSSARRSGNLGSWVVAFLMVLTIISHFRGSIYNHVDFYLYPMFYLIYIILKRYRFPKLNSYE